MPLRNKCTCFLLCIVLCVSLLPLQSGAAEAVCGHLAEGTNVEKQDYNNANYAKVIQSHLTVTADGELMRVQANALPGQYFVEYYDAKYQFLRSLTVEEELPIFGGFFASGSHYYILSGQENPNESPSVECFRITQYDLNWKRLASDGLYDCNTTIPFRASNARFALAGKYLLIRTGHQMYKAGDGLNHQANVTIEVNTERMKITQSFTKVDSTGGYVSHSFNQFIQAEGEKVVSVDHGDAYPRSIVLTEYPITDGSIGWDWYRYTTRTDLLKFPGDTGENYTGASVGGFELSDSAYLVAYSSVVLDENFRDHKTRNIYVAVMDKASSQVTIKQITDLAEGKGTTSTPHLVKFSDNAFLLLWSQAGNVYYAKLDGKGDIVGDIYCMRGAALSDCVPVLSGGKLIWYTWTNGGITFYDIDTSDLSKNDRVATNRMEILSYPTEPGGDCTLRCTVCDYKETFKTAADITVFWRVDKDDPRYHCPIPQTVFDVNTVLPFMVGDNQDITVRKDLTLNIVNRNNGQTLGVDLEGVSVSFNNSLGSITFNKPGTYEITISYLYNPLVKDIVTVEIICEHEFGSWTSDGSEQHVHSCGICDLKETQPHQWDGGKVIKDPAGGEQDVRVYTCAVCGEEKTVNASLGDVNGDGAIDATDYMLLKRAVLGTFTLTAEQEIAADVNGDGKVEATDYMLVKRHVLGTYKIW